jgi:hypothetical protein
VQYTHIFHSVKEAISFYERGGWRSVPGFIPWGTIDVPDFVSLSLVWSERLYTCHHKP